MIKKFDSIDFGLTTTVVLGAPRGVGCGRFQNVLVRHKTSSICFTCFVQNRPWSKAMGNEIRDGQSARLGRANAIPTRLARLAGGHGGRLFPSMRETAVALIQAIGSCAASILKALLRANSAHGNATVGLILGLPIM